MFFHVRKLYFSQHLQNIMKSCYLSTSVIAYILLLIFLPHHTAFSQPSLDDFLTEIPADDFMAPVADEPAKGIKAPTEVLAPEKVKASNEVLTKDGEKTIVVEAAHTQDAINASVEKMRKLQQDIAKIKVGSGEGVVARGYASYETYSNRNASLISKRLAYVKAHMQAKKNLMEFLYGLTNDSKTDLSQSVDSYDEGDGDSLGNSESVFSETINQKVEGLIRGAVIYDVHDDDTEKEVEVSIVTTPKTRGETMQVSGGVTQAKTIREGVAQVLNELKSGVLPPTGGKIITANTKNGSQLYFVAFGSAIIPSNKNRQMARILKTRATKTAQARAAASLAGLIIGEQGMWSDGITTKTEESLKQFNEVLADAPGADLAGISRQPLDETRTSFLNVMKTKEAYSFAQKGQLPPGLQPIRWVTEDGDWAYSAYVYNPTLTLDAQKVQDSINKGPSILQRGNNLSKDNGTANAGSSKPQAVGSSKDSTDIKAKPINKGPSGKVFKDEDL